MARRPRWERLSNLLDKADGADLSVLSPEEVNELFRLYRLASSDLNQAQTQTGNPAVLEYLESTVGRAYGILAPPARTRLMAQWWHILRHAFPATIRAERGALFLATLTTVAGVLFGWTATAIDPDLTRVFLPPEHLVQTPSERVAELEEMERTGVTPAGGLGHHATFSSFLFTHNIRVSIFAFGLGLTFGVGTLVLLFYNGALLGSIAQAYLADGVFEFFVAWVGPHGSIEIPSIIFAGTAGFMLARAQWRLDGSTTWRQIAQIRPQLTALILGTASLLVIAGLIEGGFSQINEPTLPYPLKITVAATLFVTLCLYLFVMPVKTQLNPEHDEFAS